MFEYNNGFRKALYWSREKMINHADKYSQAFSKNATRGKYPKVSFADFEAGKYDPKDAWLYSSNWYQDFDAMAYKTMLRQLISKWGIMSIDLQQAFEADDHIISEEGTPQEAEEINIESEVVNEQPAATPKEAPASADASAALFS
jgi:recombination protein RecT